MVVVGFGGRDELACRVRGSGKKGKYDEKRSEESQVRLTTTKLQTSLKAGHQHPHAPFPEQLLFITRNKFLGIYLATLRQRTNAEETPSEVQDGGRPIRVGGLQDRARMA